MVNGILYRITNLANGYCYIGSTLHEKSRISRHLRHLHKGKHVNKRLQEDFNRYGADDFIVEVIQRDIPEETLYLEEMAAIFAARYDSDDCVYNVSNARRISPAQRKNMQQKNLLKRQLMYNRLGNKTESTDNE